MSVITTKLLQSDHKPSWQDLIQYMVKVQALQTELIADHAVTVTLQTELKADIATIATFQAALTAKLDADAGITDTNYAATLTEVVAVTAPVTATLTATDPASTHTFSDIKY